MIRVLIADDHVLPRDACARCSTRRWTSRSLARPPTARRRSPGGRAPADIVIMDIRMPRVDGIEATRPLLARDADAPRVLVLTTFDLDEYVFEALEAGAGGDRTADRTLRRE